LIKVKDISKRYGTLLALDNVSFELSPGETVGFLGTNGAGKSTTMKIVTGSLRADKGSVSVFGYDMEKKPVEAKKRIGYLSEDNPMPEEMYVREYLEYIANIFKISNVKESVSSAIENFGLSKEYKKKISSLSKGNRQKLGLAQALIHNSDFLVLDEPTSGLDPNQQDEIKEMITRMGKSKIILFSTHILQDVQSLASRVIIINKGTIQADKKMEEVDSVEELFYSITR